MKSDDENDSDDIMEDADQQKNGPKYKFTTFMFGNVNTQAKLEEEYAKEDELESLNDVDKCHVTEVEVRCSEVLKDAQSKSDESVNLPNDISSAPDIADYYDEKEALPDPDILLISKNSSQAVLVQQEDEDDYDDIEIVSDFKTEILTTQSSEILSQDSQNVDNFSSLMPPPSQVPGFKLKLKDANQPSFTDSMSPNLLDRPILNTPLGNLMPPEYADVPIKELFPEFDPDDTPKWMRIFRLAHPLFNYHEIKDRHIHLDQCFWKPNNDDIDFQYHLYYDDYLDLGALPMTDKHYAKFEETCELFHPISWDSEYDSVSKFLAGNPKTWWNRAFDALLAGKPKEAALHTRADEWRMPKIASSEAAAKPELNDEDQTVDRISLHRLNSVSSEDNAKVDISLQLDFKMLDDFAADWRNGPAKYWYDQLGIPEDADITSWTDWQVPNSGITGDLIDRFSPKESSVEDNIILAANIEPSDSEANLVKIQDSFVAVISPKEFVDNSKQLADDQNDNTLHLHNEKEKLINLISAETVTSDSSEIPTDAVKINAEENLQLKTSTTNESIKQDVISSVSTNQEMEQLAVKIEQTVDKNEKKDHVDIKPKLLPDKIYPYMLLNWEDDIIYDAQLSSNKIAQSAKQNAAYAGWIPSQNCRTMNAFLDSYHTRYPAILPAKALFSSSAGGPTQFSKDLSRPTNRSLMTGVRTGAAMPTGVAGTQNTWPYALFPIDNFGILNDSWEADIIYDPVQAAHIPPYLLTLNLNDEFCLHDETLSDADLAALALAVVNNPNAKQIAARYGISETSLKTLLSHVTMEDGSSVESTSSGVPVSGSKQPLNRTSFHVSFGFASTKGMLTGALAKAAKGAEKVKKILSKHGLLAKEETQQNVEEDVEVQDSNMACAAAAAIGLPPKDPLNLSNDEYYSFRGGGTLTGSLARCGPLQHSMPAIELWPPIFPTYMNPLRLQQFHRVPLKKYNRGPMAYYNTAHPLVNLTRMIAKKLREREDAKAACGGGDIFFMRSPQDLTGADGEIVLFENSEEYPPLIMQVGMATRLINYYRPMAPRDPTLSPDRNASAVPPDLAYGSVVNVGSTDSPFLGTIRPGGYLQTLENNMFRSPIYEHRLPQTDFLVIRNRNGLAIRKIATLYCVGQQVPIAEVPSPNSKRANNFMRDFLQVYVLRMYMQSTDDPRRIKMEDIREAFPNHSESSIRKRLKISSDFKRTGTDASWWVLRSDYKIPTEEEIRCLVSPEDVCAYYSMLAAEMRLKEAGYGEKCLAIDDINPEDEDKEGQPKLEDEVKAAPWNTTRAFLASQRGGCFLELHGAADPTGCGEAFSYSKASTKPGALFRQAGGEAARGLLTGKRTVTGTDADLRKLHLRDAKALLRSYGISEADLKTFKRWEIIDMVRFTSTERAKQGEEEDTAKFARGNRLSLTEQVRCYREECQRIFDLQNRVLTNPELLSSDEEVSSEEEEEDQLFPDSATPMSLNTPGKGLEQNVAKNIQSLMSNKITSSDLAEKQEEADRQQLLRCALEGKDLKKPRKTNPLTISDSNNSLTKLDSTSAIQPGQVVDATSQNAGALLDIAPSFSQAQRKTLKIIRTFQNPVTGDIYDRIELVPWSPAVEIYLKIKQTRDSNFIHAYVGTNEDDNKEAQKKEKRRIQEQLRRMRRQDPDAGIISGPVGRPPKMGGRPSSYMIKKMARERESGVGFEKKKFGPKYRDGSKISNSNTVQNKLRCGACGQLGHMRTNRECPMYGKSGTTALPDGKRKGKTGGRLNTAAVLSEASLDQDSVAAAQEFASKSVSELLAEQEAEERRKRRRLDDLEEEIEEVGERQRIASGSLSSGGVPGFGSGPDDDQDEAVKKSLPKLKFKRHLLDQLSAASHMVQNANAVVAAYKRRTNTARRNDLQASAADDDYPKETVRNRDNRRRIDPRVALNHVFEGIFKEFTQISGHKVFMQPVKERDYPNYYNMIKNPIDLSKVRMKLHDNVYTTREEFLADIRLIYSNSAEFNGRFSALTEAAQKMCALVIEQFAEREEKLMRLESMVNPLLDEDDLVGLSYLLTNAIEEMRNVEHSRPFHFPVDGKRYPDYYKKISNPMDVSTLERRVKQTIYHNREEFFADAELILQNCIEFNGESSPLTAIARTMLDEAKNRLCQDEETLETIESNIRSKMADDISVSMSDSFSHGGFSDRSRRQSVTSSVPRGAISKNKPSSTAIGFSRDGQESSKRTAGVVRSRARDSDDDDFDDNYSSWSHKKKPRLHPNLDSLSGFCDENVFSDVPLPSKARIIPGEYNPSFLDEHDDEDEQRFNQPIDLDSQTFAVLSENIFDDEAVPAGGELLDEPAAPAPSFADEGSTALAHDLQLSESDDEDSSKPPNVTASSNVNFFLGDDDSF